MKSKETILAELKQKRNEWQQARENHAAHYDLSHDKTTLGYVEMLDAVISEMDAFIKRHEA